MTTMFEPRETSRRHKRRVVVIGAGFGGLSCARDLAGVSAEVVVIDKRNHHTFQPLLYQVATAGLDADDICYATRGIFKRQRNARAMQGQVTTVDFDSQIVHLDGGSQVSYDYLVMAVGAVTADFGVPGVEAHGFGLKSVAEALHVRNHVLRCFERAERVPADRQGSDTTVVVAGGGPTGVEMSGGLSELIHRVLQRDFPGISPDKPRVVLVEGSDRLLSTFSPSLGGKARKKLEKMGVEVLLNTQVTNVTPDEVMLDTGETIQASTLVWAAGVKAHPMVAALGLETSRGGRAVVDEQLRLPGHSNVFVVGDVAAVQEADGTLVPQVAPAAIQGGKYVAEIIAGELTDGSSGTSDVRPFSYTDKGSMATIGRNSAVVEMPEGRTVTGFAGWLAWLALHLVMLIGFRNRTNVLVNWAYNYVTYDRGSRLIIELETTPNRSEVESGTADQ